MAIEVPKSARNPVQQQAIPNVRVDTRAPQDVFGSGDSANRVTAAVAKTGDIAMDIAAQARDQADDLASSEAYKRSVREKNRLTWGEGGAYTKEGKDAFNVVSDYGTQFKKYNDDVQNGLTNDRQKAMFQKMRENQELDMDTDLQKYTFTQVKKYDDEETNATLSAARDDAILNYQTPGKVDQQIGLQKALIVEEAKRKGYSPDVIALKTAEATSKTQLGVINRMMANGQDQEAKDYYYGNADKKASGVKDQVTGEDAANIERSLQQATLRGESQRQSDTIMSKRMSMQSSLDEAKKITDPDVRDATVSRIKDEFQTKRVAKEESQRSLFESAANLIEKNPSVNAIAPQDWANLELNQRQAIEQRIKQLNQGIDPKTDWTKYYDLKTLASNPQTRDQFLKTPLLEVRPNMADTEFKELVNLQSNLRIKNPDTEKQMDGYRTEQQIVEQGIGETYKGKSKSDKKKMNEFRSRIDEQIGLWKKQNNKTWIPNEETQKIVDSFMLEVVTDRGLLWDTKVPAIDLEPGQEFEVDFDSIPREEKKSIKDALQRANRPFTPEAAVQMYKNKINKKVVNE